MLYKAFLSTFLFLSPALASPTSANSLISGTKTFPLVRRVDPSPYPGSDSTEFTNEPLYLNFDINNNVDSGRVRRIHYSFGNEVFLLISAGRSAANAGDRTIFARFFEDSASKAEAVTQVFDSLRDENGDPQSLVNSFIFDNTDFGGLCLASNTTFGYTAFDDDTDGLEKTHFCASAFAFPDLNKIACGTLDAYPSARMDNLARIMLNVFVKYSTVGLVTEVYQPIVDVTNNDGLTAYYPSRTHGLLVQDGRGSAADVNADNYAWLGQNAAFKSICSNAPNGGNFVNPPPYTAGVPGDP